MAQFWPIKISVSSRSQEKWKSQSCSHLQQQIRHLHLRPQGLLYIPEYILICGHAHYIDTTVCSISVHY